MGVATLKGHALAVTSVDWRIIKEKSLLASCSDDRVRNKVYNFSIHCVCIVYSTLFFSLLNFTSSC